MSSRRGTALAQLSAANEGIKTGLSILVILCLTLLMIFPAIAGVLAAGMAIAGLIALTRYWHLDSMHWHFLALCLLLPASYLLNMVMTGWVPGYLDRPSHLLLGWMIFFLIGRYGLKRNTLFYAAFAAALIAFGIAVFEALYLGNARVFGLGNRWNAVPFGNFSMLLGFFCLCGVVAFTEKNPGSNLRSLLGWLGFICGLSASILSGSRGGWMAAPFLVGLCIFFNQRLCKRSRSILLMLFAIVALLAFMTFNRASDRFMLAKNEISAYIANPDALVAAPTSTGMRLAMWRWGLQKFREHPYTGIGLAAYDRERSQAVSSGKLPQEFESLANLHSEMITALALGGIPAGLALIAFWIAGWRFFALRLKDAAVEEQYYLAMCGLVAVLGTGLFSVTEGLFGTSAGTKALVLAFAIPAGALHFLVKSKGVR